MNQHDADDWRIAGQEQFLYGAVFELRTYAPPRPNWDHDHCEFCWGKFSETETDGCLNAGYVTTNEKHWVCERCFSDFQAKFQFSLREL